MGPERKIEDAVCKYAKEKGWLTYKFTSPGNNGVPDRIVISPTGRVLFIEFKSDKGLLTNSQSIHIQRLQRNNCKVYVVNNVEQGKLIIDLDSENENI